MLWEKLGRAEMIGWDAFHRWNAAGKRVMDANKLANEFFQLTRELEFQFGFGQGRLLDRQVANFMGVTKNAYSSLFWCKIFSIKWDIFSFFF